MKFFKIFVVIFIFSLFCQKLYSEINVDVDHLIIQDHHSGKILFEKECR